VRLTRRKRVIWLSAIAASFGFCFLFLRIWLERKFEGVSPAARPAVEAVFRARCWSKLSGSYWENEMIRQANAIAGLGSQERADFYRWIILNCDLDTSRATLFVEAVGDDAELLCQDLARFRTSPQFHGVAIDQRNAVEKWADEFRIIVDFRKPKP
jgi:hypothetical protein